MLPTSLVKEDLSLAYVMAVAASAGFSTEITRRDLDSVDVRICGKGRLAADVSLLSPEVCLQLKASSVERGDGSTFTFDLPIKNYDELRGERVVPRLLVVYELPSERERWAGMDAEQLVLRRAAYWTSLKSEPAVVNETKRRIVVDRAKLFDTTAIRQILLAVARQEELG